jgi:hypothetical protein
MAAIIYPYRNMSTGVESGVACRPKKRERGQGRPTRPREVIFVSTIRQGQTPERGRGSWSRTRWLVLSVIVAAIAVGVVLIAMYGGGGTGGGY